MRAMKNEGIHLDPRVQQARMSIARQLFAHRVDHLKAAKAEPTSACANAKAAMTDAEANEGERTRAVDHVAELLAARPRYASRRGHYLPYGLRTAGGR